MKDTVRNASGKVFGARKEYAGSFLNKNKMHLSLHLRSMDGDHLLMISELAFPERLFVRGHSLIPVIFEVFAICNGY